MSYDQRPVRNSPVMEDILRLLKTQPTAEDKLRERFVKAAARVDALDGHIAGARNGDGQLVAAVTLQGE